MVGVQHELGVDLFPGERQDVDGPSGMEPVVVD